MGHPQAVRRAGPARAAVRRGVRRHRHRHADAQRRDRGDREGVRVDRADPDGPGARHAADPAVRHRRAEAALPAAAARPASGRRRSRCPSPRRAPTRRRCAPRRCATATSGSSTATKNWITNAGDRRLLHRVRHRPTARRRADHAPSSSRRTGPGFSRRQARAQARHQGLADRPAGLRRRPRARREPDRRGGQGPERRARHARAHAPRRRRAGRRDRAGRDRLRRRLRQGAHRSSARPISEFQGIQFKLADMETRTAAARELLYRACADGRPQRAGARQVHVDGQAVRLRHRDVRSRSRPSRCSAATATSTSTRSSA